ncbi:head decoration protein [Nocardia sp. NPDC050435]|uniref:head decoration protein n=1 Tax=Nocardia sp. NPDC050435 TaxID=3155040 RepID=UPI0033F3F059
MSNIAVRQTGIRYGDSRVWVYADQSEQRGRASVTLDMSKFTPATHYPKGYLPSGIVLGKITASGLYGPYDNTATDGREVAAGFLWDAFTPTDTTGKESAPLWVGVGLIQENKLPSGHGLDAAAKTDLAGWFKFF